jgi:predicted cupin superfamily sugar epimerase
MPLSPDVHHHIDTLGLEPHPEGGWYRETWRAGQTVTAPAGVRPAATSIYFLLAGGAISRLHRLRQEELWCYQAGPGITLHVLEPHPTDPAVADHRQHHVGPGGALQVVVPAGAWLGAESGDRWGLVACICAPGFDFADLEFGDHSELTGRWPHHREVVDRLLPPAP